MKKAVLTLVAMLGWAMLDGGILRAQDWPQWRGPNRDAKVEGFKAPQTWPKELTQKWKVTVGGGDATPSLVGDKLYVFSRQGGDEVLRCLDGNTGMDVWMEKYEVEPATPPAGGVHAGPRSSPAVAEHKIVTLGVRGTLSCFDAATGKLQWRKDEYAGHWPTFFAASSPLIVNGLCIAQLGGKENGRGKEEGGVIAYDLADGKEKWKWTGGGPAYSSPVLMTVDGTKLVIAETETQIVALNADNGKLVWEAPFKTQRMSYNAATPLVEGQTLIYGGGSRPTTAVKLEKQGDTFMAKELWANKQNSVQFNTPVVKDHLLFGISQRHDFFCVNTETGKTNWTAPAGQTMRGGPPGGGQGRGRGSGGRGGMGRGGMGGAQGYGSIVDAGSVLLALTPSSELVVFEPSDKKFTEVKKYKVAPTQTFSYPVVSGNRVFVKDTNSVTLWTIE